MFKSKSMHSVASKVAQVLLFVPMIWAFVVSGATLLVIDGVCILLLIWLGKKLIAPVIAYLKVVGHKPISDENIQ